MLAAVAIATCRALYMTHIAAQIGASLPKAPCNTAMQRMAPKCRPHDAEVRHDSVGQLLEWFP